jgi:hypothetical protein
MIDFRREFRVCFLAVLLSLGIVVADYRDGGAGGSGVGGGGSGGTGGTAGPAEDPVRAVVLEARTTRWAGMTRSSLPQA